MSLATFAKFLIDRKTLKNLNVLKRNLTDGLLFSSYITKVYNLEAFKI